MDRIPACNCCHNDGRCQYQQLNNCQICHENLKEKE